MVNKARCVCYIRRLCQVQTAVILYSSPPSASPACVAVSRFHHFDCALPGTSTSHCAHSQPVPGTPTLLR